MASLNSVVIIDDSDTDIMLLEKILLSINYADNIVSFSTPREAYKYFEDIVQEGSVEKMPAVIFLDLNMPVMSGFQFLDSFNKFPKEITENTKFVVVSSSDSTTDIQRSRKYDNVIKYMIKPVSDVDFLDDDL